MPNGDDPDYSKSSWAEWKGAVGARIDNVEQNQSSLFKLINEHDRKLAYMAGRAGAFGAAGGGIVALVLLLLKLLLKSEGG